MSSDYELISILREYASTSHPGKMGCECVVDKSFLSELADRFELLAFPISGAEKGDNEAKAQKGIQVLRSMLSIHQWEPIRPELEFAINEMGKCIPAKPVRKEWRPNRCPNCGANLGGTCDDGYYQNPYYESCPECRQILDYTSY